MHRQWETGLSGSSRTSPIAGGCLPPTRDFPASLGGPPKLERFIVVVVDEPTTKLAALTAGELDMAGIQPAHAQFVQRDPDLTVVTYPLLLTYGIVLNTRRPRSTTLRCVTRSTVHSTDARSWTATSTVSAPRPRGPFRRMCPAIFRWPRMRERGAGPDPSRGRARFELLTVGSGEAALEQMVQAQLSRAGFDVVIRQLELSAFLARVYGPTHDFDAAVLGIPGDAGLGYLAPLADLAGLKPPAGAAAMQRFFSDSVPVAFLYHARGLQGMNRRVRGVTMDHARRAADRPRLVGHPMSGIARAAAPVRLDFAGGWTDVPPFSTREGGTVVAAAIGLYARAEVRARSSRSSTRGPRSRRESGSPRRVTPRPRGSARAPLGGGPSSPGGSL